MKTLELDNGWRIVMFEWLHRNTYAAQHFHPKHGYTNEGTTYGNTVSPRDPLFLGGIPVCNKCQQPVPDEVIGFLKLCEWRL